MIRQSIAPAQRAGRYGRRGALALGDAQTVTVTVSP